MTPNSMAAPINALTIDPIANTAKIVAKLNPINAAKPYKHNCATVLDGLFASTALIPSIAKSGAKITRHFVIPVKKTCNYSGVVPIQ